MTTYYCDDCKMIFIKSGKCPICSDTLREIGIAERNRCINAFAKKWLPVYKSLKTPGWFDRDTGRRAEMADDLYNLGFTLDMMEFATDYPFEGKECIEVCDDIALFSMHIDKISNIDVIGCLLMHQWRYRVGRREYTDAMIKWVILALETLIKLTAVPNNICPVCKNECASEAVCSYCGFREVGKTFINKNEAELWYKETLIPYRKKYLDQFGQFNIENNILKKICKENKSVAEINVPYGITKIFNKAFEKCDWITDVNIPLTVNEICTGAFRGCRNLRKCTISEGCIKFGKEIFANCSNLQSVQLPEGTTEITDRMFFGCKSLAGIFIPKTVAKIRWQAFLDCYSLTELNIPDSVQEIESCAFGFCTTLQSIKLGKNVKKIADDAFHYCGRLSSIDVSDNERYIVQGNSLIDKRFSKLIRGCNSSFIPYGVKIIGKGAFSGCEKILSIQIPPTVTEICDGAFSSCSSLSYLIIPESVKKIGYNSLLTELGRRINIYCEHESKPAEWHNIWNNNFDALTGEQKCVYWAGEWHYEQGEPVPNNR